MLLKAIEARIKFIHVQVHVLIEEVSSEVLLLTGKSLGLVDRPQKSLRDSQVIWNLGK